MASIPACHAGDQDSIPRRGEASAVLGNSAMSITAQLGGSDTAWGIRHECVPFLDVLPWGWVGIQRHIVPDH